ncbi:hypothetical protein LZ190_03725 [Rhodovulum sulfidophilum]|nr:hypothetical protein [Rhodovulum sulfidophilum]
MPLACDERAMDPGRKRSFYSQLENQQHRFPGDRVFDLVQALRNRRTYGEVMTRQPLWERRISPELGTWEGRSVDWGRAYCLGRCQAIARAMTGTDPVPDLPDYASEYEAAKGLVSFGFGSIEAVVDARLERLPITMARRSDWVMGDAAGGDRPDRS